MTLANLSVTEKDATDQILGKSAQQFQRRRQLLTHDDGRRVPEYPPLILIAHHEPSALLS
jgi:hypothetical protein